MRSIRSGLRESVCVHLCLCVYAPEVNLGNASSEATHLVTHWPRVCQAS